MKTKKLNYQARKTRQALVFVSPYILGILIFFLFPVIFSITISFGEFSMNAAGWEFKFLGLAQYINAFKWDANFTIEFYKVLISTVVNTPLIVVFSLVIATLLNQKFKLTGVYRFIFFLPFVLGTGYVMKYLLGMGAGENAMDTARKILLPEAVQEYLSPKLLVVIQDFFSRITLILWNCGMQIVLFLAGFQSIPGSLYESAKIDGATEWELFWKITIPMISPITFLVVIFTLIESFVDPSSKMLEMFYDYAFVKYNFSYSSALSWMYFGVVLVIIGIVFAASKKLIYSEV